MARLGSTARWRLVLAFLAAGAAAATTALSTSSSDAAPAGNCTYYSDASPTTVFGQYGYDCCNNLVAWGSRTSFYECGGCFICFPPLP